MGAGITDTFLECVYAVSLGYLDFCVGLYPVDKTTAQLTQMITVTTDQVYFVSKLKGTSLV